MSRVHDGNMAGLAVITKAGAFGGEDALEKIIQRAGTERHRMIDLGKTGSVETHTSPIPVKRG